MRQRLQRVLITLITQSQHPEHHGSVGLEMLRWLRLFSADGEGGAVDKFVDICASCVLAENSKAFDGEDWSNPIMINVMTSLQSQRTVQDMGILIKDGSPCAGIRRRFYLNVGGVDILDD